jgi:chromosome segregation ATPase
MAEKAQITSVEAIESFRSSLIVFLGQSRPALEEVGSELARMKQWLQDDRRVFWQTELRKRGRKLEEAKQELFNATLSQLNEASALHHMAVQRGQRAVQEAEDKLKILKKWERELENRAAPLMKQVDQLHGFLLTDMAGAVAHLGQVIQALDAYTSVAAGGQTKTEAAK